jgi:hypothetical protein
MDATLTGRSGQRQHPTVSWRSGLTAVAICLALTIPQLAEPQPTAAGSSCTGWTSQSVPPRTIRVLRSGSGRVDKVPFRRYVAEVMASGEWPSRLRRATLEAGAVAVKQYAWYYALRGHHRHGYARNGHCYDVRDDTNDQLYRPDRAFPSERQQRAIETTWALTLRKYGRFFLTGYRQGEAGRCAADANGWKLFERSVEDCASRGWSRQHILNAYLDPHLSSVWSIRLGPILRMPAITLRPGSLAEGAVTVSWSKARSLPAAASYTLQRKVGRGPWRTVELSSAAARQARVWVKPEASVRFRVRGTDPTGRAGSWSYSNRRTTALRGPVGAQLGGSSPAAARATSSTVAARVRGRAVALVASTGPGMGEALISVNGRRVGRVDLERATAHHKVLVWTKRFSEVRHRRVRVRIVGNRQPVDFQGFLVLR